MSAPCSNERRNTHIATVLRTINGISRVRTLIRLRKSLKLWCSPTPLPSKFTVNLGLSRFRLIKDNAAHKKRPSLELH